MESATVAFVKAVEDNHSHSFGELQFSRGDMIRVLDKYPLRTVLLGELEGVIGHVPKSKIQGGSDLSHAPLVVDVRQKVYRSQSSELVLSDSEDQSSVLSSMVCCCSIKNGKVDFSRAVLFSRTQCLTFRWKK